MGKYNSHYIERNQYLKPKEGTDPKDNHFEYYERPVIVCLCGSTRFKDQFVVAAREETLAGKIVLSVGMFGHAEAVDMNGPVKKDLDELHLRKIDLADEVLILNLGGYIGESTARELTHAKRCHKTIRYLEPVD